MNDGDDRPKAGRQRTHPKWKQRAFGVKGQHETWGAGRIAAQLEKDYPDDAPDWPSESVVRRFLRTYDGEAGAIFRHYRWPEAMLQGLVEWEAGAALFELQRLCRDRGDRNPPTIQQARWYWRLTLAAPDAPAALRDLLARILAATELLPGDARHATQATAEAMLFYQPWASDEHQKAYDAAVAAGDIAQVSLTVTPGTTIEAAVDAIAEMTAGAVERGGLRSLFEAWAKHPELSPPEALAAEVKEGSTQ